MADKRPPTAAVVLRRPAKPLTHKALLEALQPLLDLLDADADDLQAVNVTHGSVRLTVVPRFKGKRQLDQVLRVTYSVLQYDPEDD